MLLGRLRFSSIVLVCCGLRWVGVFVVCCYYLMLKLCSCSVVSRVWLRFRLFLISSRCMGLRLELVV